MRLTLSEDACILSLSLDKLDEFKGECTRLSLSEDALLVLRTHASEWKNTAAATF